MFIDIKVPVTKFIERIRKINSPNVEILPLRGSKEKMPSDNKREIRIHNRKAYSGIKSKFLREFVFEKNFDSAGIYFFLPNSKIDGSFYYIGSSGSLPTRVSEHFTNLDFILYSIAFPENLNIYRKESLSFYEKTYPEKLEEYTKQFDCLNEVELLHVAWVTNNNYQSYLWKPLELQLIYDYKPCVNLFGKDRDPTISYKKEYKEIVNHIFNNM